MEMDFVVAVYLVLFFRIKILVLCAQPMCQTVINVIILVLNRLLIVHHVVSHIMQTHILINVFIKNVKA